MLKDCEFNDRTMIIVSLAFCVGVGLTQTDANFFSAFPQAVGDIFNGNAVAGVFVCFINASSIIIIYTLSVYKSTAFLKQDI